MSQKIIRIYDSASQGDSAAKRLQDRGFENVFYFTGPTGKKAASAADRSNLVSELMNAHIWKGHAEAYADRLSKGGSLVAVYAPFGTARRVGAILDKYEPVDVGFEEAEQKPDLLWDDAAPLSSILWLPVLTDIKLPAELLSGVPSLTEGKAFLSTILGLSLLKEGVQHATSSWGLPLLSKSPTPLSSASGMAVLSRNPTPLSSLFKIPVLTDRQ